MPVDLVVQGMDGDPAVLLGHYSTERRGKDARRPLRGTLTALAARFLKP
jgi:hypothetical protein